MKKLTAVVMTMLLALGVFGTTAFADTTEVNVYVTIADENGALALAQEEITVSDVDADGAITINDALYAAHEAKYEGGAAAGYAASTGDYGLSMDKLWGTENGGSYGYYVNNASAWSLTDPVAEGDYVNAYVFTDLAAWSDTYSFFDVNTAEAEEGEEIMLKLSYAGYDADWNPVTLPVEGAVITVNGEATEFTTDAEGNVKVTIDEAGEYVISAESDAMTLVPPVCKVTVSEVEIVTPDEDNTPSEDTADDGADDSENEGTPEKDDEPATGDGFNALICVAGLLASVSVLGISLKKREN